MGKEESTMLNGQGEFFDALAQFSAVWPDLSKDMTSLLSEEGDVDIKANFINTFASLIFDVATKWAYPNYIEQEHNLPVTVQYNYQIRFSLHEIEEQPYYQHLILNTSPGSQIGPNGQFPSIYWVDTSISPSVTYELEAMPNGQECVYTYPQDILALQVIQHQIEFRDLDIMVYQNALAGAAVKRNQNLVETPTNESFVFQSPTVVFNQAFVPFMVYNQAIPIEGDSLSAALTALFQTLFEEKAIPIKIAATYGFQLIANTANSTPLTQEIVSQVPVIYLPKTDYTNRVSNDLAEVLNDWMTSKSIPNHGGRYIFDLVVFATVDDHRNHPVITLKNLVFYLEE